jgi:hypothetical protein
MTYAYCDRCERPLREPTPVEILDEVQECDNCHYRFTPSTTQKDLILHLVNGLAKLAELCADKEAETKVRDQISPPIVVTSKATVIATDVVTGKLLEVSVHFNGIKSFTSRLRSGDSCVAYVPPGHLIDIQEVADVTN